MSLVNLLTQRKNSIHDRWAAQIVSTYPAGTQVFLQNQKNASANPVGHSIREHSMQILEGLLCGVAIPELQEPLEFMVRVRSVQDFHPAQAVGFIFLLKYAVRQELEDVRLDSSMVGELLTFESRIDDLALFAFNIYMGCREQLYEMRATMIRNRTHKLLEKADLLKEIPSFAPDMPGVRTDLEEIK